MRFHKLEESINQCIDARLLEDDGGLSVLKKAQKFFMGDVESIPRKTKLSVSEFPRLPYPKAAFEFEVPYRGVLGAVAICEEIPEGIFIRVWLRQPDERWDPAGNVLVEPDNNRRMQLFDEVFVSGLLAEVSCEEGFVVTQARLKIADFLVGILGNALLVLNCINVETTVVPASAALNKKRSKSGKVPVYDYKVLVLARSKVRVLPGAGTHNRPRVHLRRGHLKHRKTGTYWWQPHAVGDRKMGVVAKDYNAKRLVEQSSA